MRLLIFFALLVGVPILIHKTANNERIGWVLFAGLTVMIILWLLHAVGKAGEGYEEDFHIKETDEFGIYNDDPMKVNSEGELVQ